MLTPEQLAHCADDIINLYSQLEEQIVRDIARRIAKTGTMTDTGIWQAQHMQELGTLHSDVLSSVAKYSDRTESELKKLFEDAGVTATEYDNEIYRQNGLNPKSLKVSDTQMQLLEAGFRKTQGNLSNLTLTTAVSSQTSFINACSLAELKASSGAFSPQQAIADAIKQVAQDGAFVIYPSGHRDRLDVAVRRNVMTGIGQTTGQICLSNAQELGCDLMEITAHAGARPSHAAWQGRVVSLSGQKGYLSLSDIGYGTGDGFKGWNCRHDWYPYFEGSSRMYSAKDLEELNAKNIEYPDGSMHTLYEAEQQQRAYERKIRATKRTLAACDEALNNLSDEELLQKLEKEFSHYSVKLKRQESELNSFCNKTGLLKDNSRSQAYGFGRSTAQKVVWKNKNTIAKSDKTGIMKARGAQPLSRYLNSSDGLYINAQKVKPIDGFEDIFIHGDKTGFAIKDKNGKEHDYYTPREFAEILRNDPNYHGGDIRLFSCETASEGATAARALATQLGVNVYAPTDIVWIDYEGNITIGKTEFENTGRWILIKPFKRSE